MSAAGVAARSSHTLDPWTSSAANGTDPASSSVIVTRASPSATSTSARGVSVTRNVSVGSARRSPRTGTVTLACVAPGANDSVPAVAP